MNKTFFCVLQLNKHFTSSYMYNNVEMGLDRLLEDVTLLAINMKIQLKLEIKQLDNKDVCAK